MKSHDTIVFYERFHDIFDRFSPRNISQKIGGVIDYLRKGDPKEVSSSIGVLNDLQVSFQDSIKRTDRGIVITRKEGDFNILPLKGFIDTHQKISGDLEDIKSQIIHLADDKNIKAFKEHYTFIDDLSNIFSN
jgi:hypothetical protein